jgi:hypothetical protein
MCRKISVNLDSLLDLVLVTNPRDEIILSTLANWAEYVSDEEIQTFAVDLGKVPGYTEEDEYHAREVLSDWRDQYSAKPQEDEVV